MGPVVLGDSTVVRCEGPSAQALSVPAADPLNLRGIVLPDPRVNPLSGDPVELLPAVESELSAAKVLPAGTGLVLGTPG